MNNIERAKQFLAFDALKGLQEELRKREERHTRTEKIVLSEEDERKISDTLRKAERGERVKITFFAHGHYYEVQGTVKEISTVGSYVVVEEGKIFFDDIYEINIL